MMNVIAGMVKVGHGLLLDPKRSFHTEGAVFVGFDADEIQHILNGVDDTMPQAFDAADMRFVATVQHELAIHTERDTMDDALVVFPRTNWIIVKGKMAEHVNDPMAVKPAWVMAMGAK